MNVLITGGTGFIGSGLALKCLEADYNVRVLGQENTVAESENSQQIREQGAEVVLASITDEEAVCEAVRGIDVVFHLAATQHEMNVPDQKFWDVNVGGTENLLQASISAGVKRFVHASTIGVYGNLEGTLDEESPCEPDNIYGVTKLEGERLVLSAGDKLPVVVIRVSETYGPGDRRLLKLFKGIKKNVFMIIGDGKNIHHAIYIDDLTEGFLLAATSENAQGKVFVLSGKQPVTTNEMVETIAKQLDVKMPRVRLPLTPLLLVATATEKLLRPMGIQPPIHRRRMDFFKKTLVFSQERSKNTLGFVPQVDFEQGAAETAKWYADQGYL
jgi:nucleoside-diphosphate-sugar epimerase